MNAGKRNLTERIIRTRRSMGWLQRLIRFGVFCGMWVLAWSWLLIDTFRQ